MLSALHPDLSACVAPHHRFRVGCLPCCLDCRLGMARRMMNGRRQGHGARGRPQGWGCGGGTIRAALTYIYINLCERAFCISKIIFVASRKRSSQEGGTPIVNQYLDPRRGKFFSKKMHFFVACYGNSRTFAAFKIHASNKRMQPDRCFFCGI